MDIKKREFPFDRNRFKRRFIKFMYDKLNRGVHLPVILVNFETTLTNKKLRAVIQQMIKNLNKNLSLSSSFAKTKLFSNFEIGLISVGEKFGILDLVLEYLLTLHRRKSQPSDLEKFSRVIGYLISSGVAIKEAIKFAAKCISNRKLKNYLLHLCKKVGRKNNIFEDLDKNLFPRWSRIILRVGEKSGSLDECLWSIAKIEAQISRGRRKPPRDKFLFDYTLKLFENYGIPRFIALKLMTDLEFSKKYKDIIRRAISKIECENK